MSLETISDNTIKEIDRFIKEGDWKWLFTNYQSRYSRDFNKICQIENKYVSFWDFLLSKFSKLPKAAIDHFRIEFDSALMADYKKSIQGNDRQFLEKALQKYFFCTNADDLLDSLANLFLEEGCTQKALTIWNRLFRYYPDLSLPKHYIAAKIGLCYRLNLDTASFDSFVKNLSADLLSENLMIENESIKLADFLNKTRSQIEKLIQERSKKQPLKHQPLPHMKTAEDRRFVSTQIPLNQVERWRYNFGNTTDRFPSILPLYRKVSAKDFLIFQDGIRIVAVDPFSINLTFPMAGIYWQKPEQPTISDPNQRELLIERELARVGQIQSPFDLLKGCAFGDPLVPLQEMLPCTMAPCAILGRPSTGSLLFETALVFANMLSTEFSSKEEEGARVLSTHKFLNCIKAFNIFTGTEVWNTDRWIKEQKTRPDFAKHKFSFCAPLITSGSNLYAGVIAVRGSEQESYVVCLDQRDGSIKWYTFLCAQRTGMTPWGHSYTNVYPTMITYWQGVLYALTNLGVCAALDSQTGQILWLTKYDRAVQDIYRMPQRQDRSFERPPNTPVVYNDRLVCLPMDSKAPIIVDLMQGSKLQIQPFKKPDYDWDSIYYLIGVINGSVVFSGSKGIFVYDGKSPNLSATTTSSEKAGYPLVEGNYLYTSDQKTQFGEILICNTVSWKRVEEYKWQYPGQSGNLLVINDRLVVCNNSSIKVYTSFDDQLLNLELFSSLSPQVPELLYSRAMTIPISPADEKISSKRLLIAKTALEKFVWLVKNDPAYDLQLQQACNQIYQIDIKLGDLSAADSRLPDALSSYKDSIKYAENDKKLSLSLIKIAKTYELLNDIPASIEALQQILFLSSTEMIELDGKQINVHDHAYEMLINYFKNTGDEMRNKIETIARKYLQDAGDDLNKLLKFFQIFSFAQSSNEAFEKILTCLRKIEDPIQIIRALNKLKSIDKFQLDLYRIKLETLKRIGDYQRIRKFLNEMLDIPSLKEFAQQELKTIKEPLYELKISPKLKQVAELGSVEFKDWDQIRKIPQSSTPFFRQPLATKGIKPQWLDSPLQLFKLGSSIELWNLVKGTRQWVRPHPGAYHGIIYLDGQQIVVHKVLGGSPAQKSGIKEKDIILRINSINVTPSTLKTVMNRFKIGDEITLTIKRGHDIINNKIVLEEEPYFSRYQILYTGFTRDYYLVIAWEDLLLAIDPKTNHIVWSYDILPEDQIIKQVTSIDGRIFALLTPSTRIYNYPYRLRNTTEVKGTVPPGLICFDDATGGLIWSKEMSFANLKTLEDIKVTLLSSYFSDHIITLLAYTSIEIRTFSSAGQLIYSFTSLQGNIPYQGTSFNEWFFYDEKEAVLYTLFRTANKIILSAFSPEKRLWEFTQDLSTPDLQQPLAILSSEKYIGILQAKKILILTKDGKDTQKVLQPPPDENISFMSGFIHGDMLYAPVYLESRDSEELACYDLTSSPPARLWRGIADIVHSPYVSVLQTADHVLLLSSNPCAILFFDAKGGKLMHKYIGATLGGTMSFLPTFINNMICFINEHNNVIILAPD